MPESERIVAVGLLTARDIAVLGTGFKRVYPVDKAASFEELLTAIDGADRKLRRSGSGRRPN
jgi:hypothetical protein